MEEILIELNLRFILMLKNEMKYISKLNEVQLHICQELSCEDDFDNDAELRYSHLL